MAKDQTPRFLDLSHALEHGVATYPGLPAPEITDFWTREDSAQRYTPGTSFHIGRITMVSNSGTYVDAPFHRYADTTDVAGLPLASIANLDGVVFQVDLQAGRGVGRSLFGAVPVRGRAVLVHTGWSQWWGTDRYFHGHPFLTAETARYLADSGAALVGIDSLNIDDTADPGRPVHSILLRAGIPVVEHLCGLGQLPPEGFRFFAVPAPVRGLGSFPVRAFAMIGL